MGTVSERQTRLRERLHNMIGEDNDEKTSNLPMRCLSLLLSSEVEILNEREDEIRERFLDLVRDEEHNASLPIRYFRVISPCNQKSDMRLTIEARTDLGAIIAHADWDIKNSGNTTGWYWEYYASEYLKKEDNTTFEDFVENIIKIMVRSDGPIDDNTYLFEVKPIVVTPFSTT